MNHKKSYKTSINVTLLAAVLHLVSCGGDGFDTFFDDAAGAADGFSPTPIPSLGSTALAPGTAPRSLSAVWFIADTDGISVSFLGRTSFSNGRYTNNPSAVLFKGLAQAMLDDPDAWFGYRVINGNFQFSRGDGRFGTWDLTTPTAPGLTDDKLDACYESLGGATLGYLGPGGVGAASASSSVWCFSTNGRFTNSSGVGITGPTGAGSSASRISGIYRIDGHVIQLLYDDGKYIRTTFGIYRRGTNNEAIVMGNNAYID